VKHHGHGAGPMRQRTIVRWSRSAAPMELLIGSPCT
jgi:hypothetical protein